MRNPDKVQGIKEMTISRILWLNHRDIMHPRAGGAERTIFQISKRLVHRGYDVILFSTKTDVLPKMQELEGITIYRLGGNISSHWRNILFENKLSSGSIVIDDMAHVIPWLSERFSSIPGTVFFRHLHRRTLSGQIPSYLVPIFTAIEKRYPLFYRKWPFVTESTQGMRDLEEMGVPSKRIVKILPGVETEKLFPKQKYNDPTLVYFGGMREYKRPYEALYLVKALNEIGYKVNLKVIGNGPTLELMKELCKKLNLTNQVVFLGRIDDNVLFDIVSRSWLNLHFSKAEGWGLSILEASACGTPTVAYEVPGVSEVISNGENGLTSTDGDRNSLLVNAITILNSYDKWINSSKKVSERYSWDKTTDMWEKHLNSLT